MKNPEDKNEGGQYDLNFGNDNHFDEQNELIRTLFYIQMLKTELIQQEATQKLFDLLYLCFHQGLGGKDKCLSMVYV